MPECVLVNNEVFKQDNMARFLLKASAKHKTISKFDAVIIEQINVFHSLWLLGDDIIVNI